MNIFIFSNMTFTKFIGGVETVLLNFSESLQGTEHKIFFVALVYDDKELKKDIIDEFKDKNLIRRKYSNDKKIRFIRSLIGLDYSTSYKVIVEILKSSKDKPDVILTIGSMLPPDVKRALRDLNLNVKVVSWVHINLIPYSSKRLKDKINQFILKWIRKRRLKYADAHLAISNGMKNQIVKLIRNAKVYTVFNPIKKYKGNLVERSIKPIFIYVGRLDDYQKNITFLLKGMSKIDKDFKLIIIGKGGDEERLKSLANDLGISQRIEWRGFKKDPYENLNEGVTALLLTS
ncbi:MAG: glycosyltransferase, partial [Athalassotoga sp.]